MSRQLSDQEIRRRLQEGRNYKHLYAQLKVSFDKLRAEHKQCPVKLAALQAKLDTQAIQIAELQTMVFGKKRRPPRGTPVPPDPLFAAAHVTRTADSYRRPVPPASAITDTVLVPLADTCVCGGDWAAGSLTSHDRYQQDIPLPELTPDYQSQLVTKFVIARGVCSRCGKRSSSRPLDGAQVTLGSNVRLLVTHLTSVGGMSYHQVASLLLVLYGLTVSDGELANLLQRQHQAWLPSYHQLQDNIRAAPVVHVDETSWSIQELQNQGYAWVLADSTSSSVCYRLENSRGALHARSLFGVGSAHPCQGVRISDDYGVYRNPELPGRQQLCWVHLYRAIRDLRYNSELPERQLPHVIQWYEQFATLYHHLRTNLQQPYDVVVRERQAAQLWQTVQILAKQRAPAKAGEPQKLTRLKAQLSRAGRDRLFTCLTSDTPCDNNRAERDLRQLVLKRKRSFGSKTQRGAQALATVLSLCTTTWRNSSRNPTGYFSALAALG
jgi:transposase